MSAVRQVHSAAAADHHHQAPVRRCLMLLLSLLAQRSQLHTGTGLTGPGNGCYLGRDPEGLRSCWTLLT